MHKALLPIQTRSCLDPLPNGQKYAPMEQPACLTSWIWTADSQVSHLRVFCRPKCSVVGTTEAQTHGKKRGPRSGHNDLWPSRVTCNGPRIRKRFNSQHSSTNRPVLRNKPFGKLQIKVAVARWANGWSSSNFLGRCVRHMRCEIRRNPQNKIFDQMPGFRVHGHNFFQQPIIFYVL